MPAKMVECVRARGDISLRPGVHNSLAHGTSLYLVDGLGATECSTAAVPVTISS